VILASTTSIPNYEKVIHDKKLAEQTGERMVSEAMPPTGGAAESRNRQGQSLRRSPAPEVRSTR